jgi:hypothetical protein
VPHGLVTETKIVGAALVSLFPLRSLTVVFLVLLTSLGYLGYFVWDGFFPRKLTNVEVSGRAQLKLAVEWQFYPLDESRKYIAVYLDNPSDYIIRGATVSAQIKLKSAGGAAPTRHRPKRAAVAISSRQVLDSMTKSSTRAC